VTHPAQVSARATWIAVGAMLLFAVVGLLWLLLGGAIGEPGGRSQGPGASTATANGGSAAGEEVPEGDPGASDPSDAGGEAAEEEVPYGDPSLPLEVSIRGRVIDIEDHPVPDAIVTAQLWDTRARPHRIRQASRVRSDAQGLFVLGPLERERFQVWAQHPEHGVALVQNQPAGSWVELTLSPAAALEGRVTARADDAPVPDARVVLVNGGLMSEAVTDADGRYRMAPLPCGQDPWNGSRLLVVAADFRTAERSRVMLTGGETVRADFALEPGTTLTGRVTDEEGRYSLAQVDAQANATFAVAAPGYRTANRQSTGENTLDFDLFRAAVVEARVRTPQGGPAAGARVYLQRLKVDADPAAVATADQERMIEVADSAGLVRFDDLLPGQVALIAFHPDYAPGEVGPVDVYGGDKATTAEITLRVGLAIAGTVRDLEGNGLQGIRVRLQPRGRSGSDYKWARNWVYSETPDTGTDEEGRFELRGILPGKHRLYAWDRRWGYGATEVEGEEGQRVTDVELRFGGGGIEGQVLSTDGQPLAGVQVVATRQDGDARRRSSRSTQSDALGRFFIEGLEEGVYQVFASTPFGQSDRLPDVGTGSAGLVLRLPPPLHLTGTVTASPGGRPIDRFQISLQPVTDNAQRAQGSVRYFGRGNTYAVRDPDGRFDVPIGAGKWNVTITAPGHCPAVERDVVVEEGRSPDPLLFRLEPGSVVTGVLRDTEGKPVPRAWIQARVQRLPGEPAGALDAWMWARDQTDSEGRFHLDGLAPGPWLVQANLGPRGAADALLTVREGSNLHADLQLMPTGTLVTTVLDQDGKPVQQAWVGLQDDKGGWLGFAGTTDAQGVARSSALRSGRARVMVYGRDFSAQPVDVVIRPAETVMVEVRVEMTRKPDDQGGG